MASPAISARLKYLSDSAHLLFTSSPSTSAYLMSRCNSLIFENGLEQSDAQKRHVCGACGNIMVLGWTGSRQLGSRKVGTRGRSLNPSGQHSPEAKVKTIVYTCERCGRRTRQSFHATASRSLKNVDKRTLSQTPQPVPILDTTRPDIDSSNQIPNSALANASSKRRAKIRKQGGLQALLAKSKESDTRTSIGFGLDLMDLMKKA